MSRVRSLRSFPNDVTAVRAARHFARGRLQRCDRDLCEVAELLVSELATNAVCHTDSGFCVDVVAGDEDVRIAVSDCGVGDPTVQEPAVTALSGRGLAIVDALATAWGVEPGGASDCPPGPAAQLPAADAVGKTVWFELRPRRA